MITISDTPHILTLTVGSDFHAMRREDFDAFVAKAEGAYRAHEAPFTLVFDLGAMQAAPTSYQCREWMKLFKRVQPVTREHLIATYVCSESPVVRLALAVFRGLYDPLKPLHVCRDVASALRDV